MADSDPGFAYSSKWAWSITRSAAEFGLPTVMGAMPGVLGSTSLPIARKFGFLVTGSLLLLEICSRDHTQRFAQCGEIAEMTAGVVECGVIAVALVNPSA